MHYPNKLQDNIEELRKDLYILIDSEKVLLDPEIIALSRKLDNLINEYKRTLKV